MSHNTFGCIIATSTTKKSPMAQGRETQTYLECDWTNKMSIIKSYMEAWLPLRCFSSVLPNHKLA